MKYTIQKSSLGMNCILLDEKLVAKLTKENNKRVVCNLNNELQIHAAILSNKTGESFIVLGANTCKKIKVKLGDIITATFEIDKSEYQFEMPEEFKEVLDTDAAANKIFESLTDGNKRGLIHLITIPKSSDKKIERALLIAEKLKMRITSPRLVLKK